MWAGTVDSIHLTSAAKEPLQSVKEAKAIPGKGLEGDRYALQQGTFSKPLPDFELTLIEAEAIDALKYAIAGVVAEHRHAHTDEAPAPVKKLKPNYPPPAPSARRSRR